MKRYFIYAILISCCSLVCIKCATKPTGNVTTNTTNPSIASSSKFVSDILDNVNRYRKSKGLSPLSMNSVISSVAEKHSEGMANGGVAFGHDGFLDRIQKISTSLGSVKESAENVAFGNLSAEQVVSNWINSPAHRENLEGNFTLTGIGISKNAKGVIYFTQIFIRN